MAATTAAALAIGAAVLGLAMAVAHAGPPERAGAWQDRTYEVRGTWTIERAGDSDYLVFSKDFRTKRGPDLKVFLSPEPLARLSGKNATRKSLKLGKLETHRGAQRMRLPADIDLSRYRSIAIHCEKYSVLFAASAL